MSPPLVYCILIPIRLCIGPILSCSPTLPPNPQLLTPFHCMVWNSFSFSSIITHNFDLFSEWNLHLLALTQTGMFQEDPVSFVGLLTVDVVSPHHSANGPGDGVCVLPGTHCHFQTFCPPSGLKPTPAALNLS